MRKPNQKTHLIDGIRSRFIGLQVLVALSQEASQQTGIRPVSLSPPQKGTGIVFDRQRVENIDLKPAR